MELKEFSELEEWHWDGVEDGGTKTPFPCLKYLSILGCPKLKSLPGFGELPQLEDLQISKASSIKKIGRDFLGREDKSTSTGVSICPFPKLKTMQLQEFSELEEWHWDGVEDGGTKTPFPCLHYLSIHGCPKLKSLPGFGELPQLKYLEISEASSIKKIGREFLGRGDRSTSIGVSVSPFPKLDRMLLWEFSELEEWHWDETEDGGTTTSFPCLKYLYIRGCPKLKSLPGFGELPQLEDLEISEASSIKKIGREFLGRGDRSTSIGVSVSPFPKLEKMELREFSELEEWHWDGVEDGGTKTPFPCLKYLKIRYCPKLKSLLGFGELPQLEDLDISKASSIKKIGREFLRREDRSTSTGVSICPFPKLETMFLRKFPELEEWHWDGVEDGGTKTPFPCLNYLKIRYCPKLKSLPGLSTLKRLQISKLPSMQHVGNLNSLEYVELCDDELGAIPSWLSNANPHTSSFRELNIREGLIRSQASTSTS